MGYNPQQHRKFLVDYFTGEFKGSLALGKPFARNEKTGDARISGSLASLVGLESAVESNDVEKIDICCRHIIMLHSLIMSFGGIPLLYYGDELAMLNDYSYLDDEQKSPDSRWIHRPRINWELAERRNNRGTTEQRIFYNLKKMIALRKETKAFADFNNRELLEVSNDACFAFVRYDYHNPADKVVVIANFSSEPQHLNLDELDHVARIDTHNLTDLWSGKTPTTISNHMVLSGYQFYWLTAC